MVGGSHGDGVDALEPLPWPGHLTEALQVFRPSPYIAGCGYCPWDLRPNDRVAATSNVVPQFSRRERIWAFPNDLDQADAVVVLEGGQYEALPADQISTKVRELSDNPLLPSFVTTICSGISGVFNLQVFFSHPEQPMVMRILLIEDEQKIANAIKRGLEQESYAVDVVYDGKEGFGKALNGKFDVLILDRMLPNIDDGLTICRAVRDHGFHQPILLLTARDSTRDRVEGLDSGADDYLVKPFSFEELLARVRRYCGVRNRPKNDVACWRSHPSSGYV